MPAARRRRATAAAASTLLDAAAEPHTPHTLRAQGRPYMLALAMVLSAVCALLGLTAAAPAAAKPNIVLFLTVRALLSLIAHGKILQGNFCWWLGLHLQDDQDQMLGASFPRVAEGGATPMPKTMHTMEEGGTMATNFFIHTPICCPSRSELIRCDNALRVVRYNALRVV
eukprot:SAG31_NODE_2617_length_5370_cov_10.481503_6_plen_170_part_00